MTLGQGNLLNSRYRVVEILGRGGMGAVYRAMDESLGVEVAVKENLFTTDDFARQFRMEAVILAGIRHPNLPRVTDHFVIDGMGQYLVMDFIDGDDLRQRMEKDGPISETEAVRIGTAACDALTYLHTRKPPILHRDIKLGNIKISGDGQIYLVDFGLAKMGWEHEETMTGARAMTPGYSPPEQYGSARTDARSDVYSLGATLYAALTGTIPEDSLARAVDGLALTPLRELRPMISPRLAAVIEKALETSPSNRYQSAEAFKQALLGQPEPALISEIYSEPPSLPPLPPSPAESELPNRQSSPFWRMLGFFMVMLLIVAGAVWFSPLYKSLLSDKVIPLLAFLATRTPLSTLPATTSPTISITRLPPQSPFPSETPRPTRTTTRTPLPSKTATITRTATFTVTSTRTTTATPSITFTPPPVPTPIGSGTGEIGFASIIDNKAQVIIANVDGSNLRQLTDEPGGACNFDWSPDGKQLVFVSPCTARSPQYPSGGLYVLDVGTGITNPLPFEPGGDFEPAWSPDGTRIAFTSLRAGSMQIYIYNLSDSSVARLTSSVDNTQSRYPAWSPDSSKIAYTVLRQGLMQIWTMSSDGGNKQLLRNTGSLSEFQPAWSPDGTFLLFTQSSSDLSAPAALIRYVFQTGVFTTLPIPQPVLDVEFSPDGQWIIYESTVSGDQDIFISKLGNDKPQRLTTSPEIDFDPAWWPAN